MTVATKVLEPGDDDVLQSVAPDVFDNPIDPNLAREFLNDPRHHIVVAVDEGLVVGFASGVDYVHPDKPRELFINEVGVAPTHRGKGLAKMLLRTLLRVAVAKGCQTAWVLTDRGNPIAMSLYKSAGGVEGADDSGPANEIVGYSFDLAKISD
jgi:aminoglycoside 6'-N-acetyltransferase I